MLQCGGCETVYFETHSINSEDYDRDGPIETVTYFPAPSKRDEPSWMKGMLFEDMTVVFSPQGNVCRSQK
jgi:hypothetical protein